jgi:hypothetical protein
LPSDWRTNAHHRGWEVSSSSAPLADVAVEVVTGVAPVAVAVVAVVLVVVGVGRRRGGRGGGGGGRRGGVRDGTAAAAVVVVGVVVIGVEVELVVPCRAKRRRERAGHLAGRGAGEVVTRARIGRARPRAPAGAARRTGAPPPHTWLSSGRQGRVPSVAGEVVEGFGHAFEGRVRVASEEERGPPVHIAPGHGQATARFQGVGFGFGRPRSCASTLLSVTAGASTACRTPKKTRTCGTGQRPQTVKTKRTMNGEHEEYTSAYTRLRPRSLQRRPPRA